MENWRDKSGNSSTTAVWKDKKSKYSKSVNWRNKDENKGQNYNKSENNFRRNHNDATHAVASSDKNNLFESDKNQYECAGPKTLENVLKISDDAKLISVLTSETNGFLSMLDQPNVHSESDSMCLILDALARASETSSEQDTVQLLGLFYLKIIPKLNRNANFHCELKLYIADLGKHLAEQSPQRHKHIEAVQNLLTFLRQLQLTIRHKSFDIVRDFTQLITAQIEFINRKGNSLNDYIVGLLAQLTESVEQSQRMRVEAEKIQVLSEPPQNFRKISIYPDVFDILGDHAPFIRENVVEGKYVAGVDHYLDVQFRLLREDFVRPLRNGISEYVQIKNKPEAMAASKYRIKDLNVYKNVQIIGSEMLHYEQVHSCLFDCTPFRNVRWQYNKRMMSGSLVCLSPDDFKTFFFGTVVGQRDSAKLAKGEFQIKLEIERSTMPEITPLVTFVMVESHVYFEAYRHNLKVLQKFGEGNFPLSKYIVDVNKDISPPSYLANGTVYEISNGLPEYEPEAKTFSVDVLNKDEWPPREEFHLDESQYEAFRAALTKQMVVIQGPPGTGKTYIGMRIVETLLANCSEWPILIVCYTNHALDQFLEGIMKYCDENELIRIGSKSQCEALQRFNLATIKSAMRSSYHREKLNLIREARYACNNELKSLQEQISLAEIRINAVRDSVLGCELENVIKECNPKHYFQLQSGANGRQFNEGILNWLGYAVNKQQGTHQDNIAAGTGNDHTLVMPQEFYEEAEMDEEEIKEMERERIIEDSSDEEDDSYSYTSPKYVVTRSMPFIRQTDEPIDLDKIVPIDVDSDGFTTVQNKHRSIKREFKYEINRPQTMSKQEAATVANITSLPPKQRWNLYRLWLQLYMKNLEKLIKAYRAEYRNECFEFNDLRQQEDVEIVKRAKIIGMTTTGAAKYRHIIDGTKPKITIVEEAAEVLEAHIVTALCKEADHLILIGDHLQLRPNPAVFELAKKFNLEISLFERLIKNEMEYHQLKQQHRMRPCISSLLVPHIYKQLLDHPSVEQYEHVKGISKDMFFINHDQNESSMHDTSSHINSHEASFVVELCRYLILQGYETSKVTILTTYSGQLHQIRQLMRGQQLLSGVRAAVVDNYQGEENDIILLSFVRSNEEGNIGFLKTSNRINVALSRARKGLYCIGNFDCFQNETKLWKNLMAYLAEQSAFGEALTVYCQNHPENKTSVKSKEDFTSLVPEGGCTLACNSRLPCGHSCTKRCHFIDAEHTDYYQLCPSRCNRIICERDHRCPKICHHGEECGNCAVLIEKLRLECQHMVRVSCSGNPSLVFCKVPCERNRSCGHKCMGTCGAACDKTTCNEVVEVGSPCGHNVTIICSDSKNDMKLLIACSEPCNFELKCGHLCKGSCAQCHYGRLHISCEEQCTRTLICGHPCPDSCSTECAPCKKKCPNSCVHAKCPSLCGYPCIPCKEKCAQRCDHSQCSKLCSEPCDRELCKHPNTKTLAKCGHPSIGVCGEKMPSLCRVCDKDDEIFSGKEENARFIELEDCKHTIEVNELIHWLTSEPDSAALNSDGNRARDVGLKKCPKCETVIRHTKSLNPFIQASLGDIEQVKSKMCGDPKQNQTTQRKLNEKVKGIVGRELFRTETISLRNLYADIYGETESGKRNVVRPKQTLIALTNKFELVETLKQICSTFEKRIKSRQSKIQPGNIEKFVQRIRMVATFIKDFKNGEQQRKDISSEISFLQLMGDAIVKICAKPFIDFSDKLLNDAFEVANKYGGATENTRKEFSNLVVEAFEKPWRLEVSLVEKRTVLRFIGFQCGYWLKCPIGHIYCIGECDGVMEHSDVYKKCPSKCGRIICERNHPCPNICHIGSECEECIVKVPKLRTECQHTVQVSCSGNPSLVHCTSPCERKRSCGHRCKTICGTACDDSTCTEMVRAKSPCGHTVTIKCSDATNDAILLDACSEPCNVKLKCGHLCKGSCVRCQYGRLHISCAEKCIRKLICGHSCPEICSNDCPPCKKKCTNSCAHVKCRLRCGEPCQPCKEKCTWRCDHLQCSKLCSEPCDRELCTHPSTQTLDKCGHSSIGVCGEKIPSLCRVCDKDNKVFHGKGEDARFIELEDCKHIFEVSALMKWLEAEPDGKNRNRIQLRKCPQCHFVIRRSQSLNTFIRGSLRDIEQVKLKTRGEPESNKAIQSDLTRKCYEILGKLLKFRMVKLDSIFMNIYTKARVACVGPSPRQTLIMLSNKFKLADALRKICLTYEDRTMSNQNVSSKSLENFEHRIRMVSAFFVGFNNSEQQRDDISTEMLFLQLVGDVIVKASAQSFNETEKKSLDDAFQLANASVRATETVRTDFLRFVNEAFANSPGLGISFNEKQLILEAISLRRGHWYKCPNGHIYCIGECGATERNKCPECGTVIDGALKILEPSDASATEMEDAPAAVNPPAVKGTITPI